MTADAFSSHGIRAQRIPTFSERSVGIRPLRFADRRAVVVVAKLPPRFVRAVARADRRCWRQIIDELGKLRRLG